MVSFPWPTGISVFAQVSVSLEQSLVVWSVLRFCLYDINKLIPTFHILIIKPMRTLISLICFWNRTLHILDSIAVHHQESITVHTAIGICHTGYADCLLAGSGWNLRISRWFYYKNISWCMVLWMSKTHFSVCKPVFSYSITSPHKQINIPGASAWLFSLPAYPIKYTQSQQFFTACAEAAASQDLSLFS